MIKCQVCDTEIEETITICPVCRSAISPTSAPASATAPVHEEVEPPLPITADSPEASSPEVEAAPAPATPTVVLKRTPKRVTDVEPAATPLVTPQRAMFIVGFAVVILLLTVLFTIQPWRKHYTPPLKAAPILRNGQRPHSSGTGTNQWNLPQPTPPSPAPSTNPAPVSPP